MKDISALLSSKELAACPSLTFKVQVNWNLLVEIIAHRAHSGLIEIAEMGSTKGSLVTKGQFNEKEPKPVSTKILFSYVSSSTLYSCE